MEETKYNLQDKDDMVKFLAIEKGYSLERIALGLGISANQVLKRAMRKREKNTVRKPKVKRMSAYDNETFPDEFSAIFMQ